MPAPWSLCVLHQDGEVLLHRDMQAAPGPFLQAIAPDRADWVVCVEGLFTWYGLADLGAQEGIPCGLGQALSMQAIHGGKAKNDRSDAHTIAVLLRGGMLPQAAGSPAEMRATRDLLRRRIPLRRTRAERLAPSQQTTSQDYLPAIGRQLAYQANREGVAPRFPDPAVQKRLDVARTLIDAYDRLLTDLELELVRTAQAHAAQPCSRLRSIPGVGKLLALVLRYAIHAMRRLPRVQACVSSGRLVTCAKASAGTRDGTSGNQSGHASRTWACSEAAVLFLRHNPAGQQVPRAPGEPTGAGESLDRFGPYLSPCGV